MLDDSWTVLANANAVVMAHPVRLQCKRFHSVDTGARGSGDPCGTARIGQRSNAGEVAVRRYFYLLTAASPWLLLTHADHAKRPCTQVILSQRIGS